MKDILIQIKIKNNILYQKIIDGWGNVNNFCVKNDFYPSEIGELLSFKKSPMGCRKNNGPKDLKRKSVSETGDLFFWKKTATRLADFFQVQEEDLFPDHLREARNNFYEIEVDSSNLYLNEEVKTPFDLLAEKDNDKNIRRTLKTISPKEEKVIRLLYGIDEEEKSIEQIAELMKVSTTRIHQHLGKGLRKLRHPSRSKNLWRFLDI